MRVEALDQKKEVARASKHFFVGTVSSRVLGLVRDVAMAYTFGSHAALAALMVAFRLSNLLRRLFGEGALHAAFVPVYETIRADSEEKGAHFFQDLSLLMGGGLLILTLLGEGTLWLLLKKGSLSSGNYQIFSLMTLLLPSLVFICHAAFCSSFLQCQKEFLLPALSPALFNVFWIIGVAFAFGHPIERGVTYLAIFILLGLFFQWFILFPKTWGILKIQAPLQVNFKRALKNFQSLGKPFLLGLIGVSTTQINNALDALFARMIHLKGPAYLWYAIRIEQVPLAIFGVALAGALLPSLSRAYLKSQEQFQELLDYTLARALGLLVPCAMALFFIGPAIVNVIFVRGHFDLSSAYQTTYCLWGYSAGLTFQGLSLILASAFYAQHRYRVTTLATLFSMGLNILLNLFFAFVLNWGVASVAWATSLSALFQVLFLGYHLTRGKSFMKLARLNTLLMIFALSLLSGLVTYYLGIDLNPLIRDSSLLQFPKAFSSQLFNFSLQSLIFLSCLFTLAKAFRVKEILALLDFLPFVKTRNN